MTTPDAPSQAASADQFARARALFPHTARITYLNSASYCPLADPVAQAVKDNLSLRLAADRDDTRQTFAAADELRANLADLIGAKPEEIGIGLSTTFGVNIAAFGLPLEPGDEVLVSDIDFPVDVYTWRAAAEARGVVVRLVKSRNRQFDVGELLAAITPRTKVLTVSFVQFFNGYKLDLIALGKICRERGIYFVVDGIQGIGVEPLDVRACNIDILACGCQKWMLGPQGSGFFFLSDSVRHTLRHPWGAWLGADWTMPYTNMFHFDKPWIESARRFEMGYYAVWNILGLSEAVKIIQGLGVERIQRHNHTLIDRLASYLQGNPYYTITSSFEEKYRSSIFTFSAPDVPGLHRTILDHRIILVHREGSIRVSAHLFNNEADIDRLIDVLEKYTQS